MSNFQLIDLVQQELQNSMCDIKAEAQLLMASEKGLRPDDYLVSCSKRFIREYSKDVIFSELKEFAGNKTVLQVQLSRSGIYDQLPEGIFFHTPQRAGRNITVADMATDYKINKKKEEEIRRFFQPFENDFFLQRLSLEQQETLLLEGLQSGILNEYFIRFWNLPASIPKAFIAPFILLLPHASKIAGDFNLTAESLAQILKEEVNIKRANPCPTDASAIGAVALGEGQLGLDMVCGENFMEDTPDVEIEIGPLKYSHVTDYLEGGGRYALIEAFNRFFIPAGVDTLVTIKVVNEKQHMIIEKNFEPVLGYTSFLG